MRQSLPFLAAFLLAHRRVLARRQPGVGNVLHGNHGPGGGAQIPARARRRCGGRAAVCGPVRGAAAAREDARLAPRAGGARRTRHLLRPEAPQRARDARRARGDRHASRRASKPPTLSEIQRYTKLFWINNGPYNNLTSRKFVLKTTPQAFATAAETAAKAGATFPTQAGESLDALLTRLQPMFFDPNVDPIVTNKTSGAGQGHPHRQRQQPLLRRQHGRPEGLHREDTG